MTVRIYRSSDASAPVLTGQIGSFIALLDACLVNGYGALASSGWAKEFSGTNLAAYRAATGNRYRLRVDDTSALEARVVGYESMSGISSGLTNAFPSDAQVSGGLYMRKSNAADATARGWLVAATGTAVIVLINTGYSDWLTAPSSGEIGQMYFGDFTSYKTGDVYNTIIIGQAATGGGLTRVGTVTAAGDSDPATIGHYVVRGGDGLGTSKQVGKRPLYDVSSRSCMGTTNYPPFPDIITNDMVVSPIGILESAVGGFPCWRGQILGLWAPLHALPGAHGYTINGSGVTAGRSFQLFNTANSSVAGRALLEISDTW